VLQVRLRPRLSRCQMYLVLAVAVNLVILLCLAAIQHRVLTKQSIVGLEWGRSGGGWPSFYTDRTNNASQSRPDGHTPRDYVSSLLTVIIREFEDFENLVSDTVEHIHQVAPYINIVIIADKLPYPPLGILKTNLNNTVLVTLNTQPDKPPTLSRPDAVIQTEYVLVIPDGTKIVSTESLRSMLDAFIQRSDESVRAFAIRVGYVTPQCQPLTVDLRRWTVELGAASEDQGSVCGSVTGEHAILMKSTDIFSFSAPFARPTSVSLYVQMALRQWTVQVMSKFHFKKIKSMFQDSHNDWKHKTREENRLQNLYQDFGIKQVIHLNHHTQWFGCSKDTPRCFGSIVNNIPEYVYSDKWTPPCCLKALRETMKHVFSTLEASEVRFWLEGGSLLGAARHHDIIPWDYDVDVGMYRGDVIKCTPLMKASDEPFLDEFGFVWEKATEGDYFRVQYSETNHMHVDIFPFYSRNGTMTKDTWMPSHRQDTEFPEHFLKPLTRIKFAGVEAPAPNNIHKFLEFKFGPGVVENPKYPNNVNVL
jgi:hypothetical protein